MSVIAVIGLVILTAGAVMHAVGVATPKWAKLILTVQISDTTGSPYSYDVNGLPYSYDATGSPYSYDDTGSPFGSVNTGLWSACDDDISCGILEIARDNFRTIRGFVLGGAGFAGIAGVLALVNVLRSACKVEPVKSVALISLLSGFLAFASIEVGTAIFGSMVGLVQVGLKMESVGKMTFGYSFYLSAAGGVLVALGSLVSFLPHFKTINSGSGKFMAV